MRRERLLNRISLPHWIIAWTLAVTLARALRWPNEYAQAHWLLDYRFGFIKRGLAGSLYQMALWPTGLDLTRGMIFGIAIAILTAACMAWCVVMKRILDHHRGSSDALLFCLVFVSSPFVVMSAHLVGYLDLLLYLLALAAVGLTLADRPTPAALISVAAVAVHENYLVIGVPLTALASLALFSAGLPHDRRRAHWAALLVPLLAFAAMTLYQALYVDRLALRQQLDTYLQATGLVARRASQVAIFQTTSFTDFLAGQSGHFVARLSRTSALNSITPSLAVMLYFAWRSSRFDRVPLLPVLMLLAVAAPLLLHAVAWDTERIWTYPIWSAFVATWIMSVTRPRRDRVPLLAWLGLLALLSNLIGIIHLMDLEVERFEIGTRFLLYAPALLLCLSVLWSAASLPVWPSQRARTLNNSLSFTGLDR
jgi:hypothetical protein